MSQEEKNKQIVTTAYQRIFGDLDINAVDDYMSKDFIQHNPTITDGPAGVKALVQILASQGIPKQKSDLSMLPQMVILFSFIHVMKWEERNGGSSIFIVWRIRN
jgi:predicted SnoaL-like aldol condensation-catalyzing enzyme